MQRSETQHLFRKKRSIWKGDRCCVNRVGLSLTETLRECVAAPNLRDFGEI
jgi:hypothetical protein